jgi:hypothetical protein
MQQAKTPSKNGSTEAQEASFLSFPRNGTVNRGLRRFTDTVIDEVPTTATIRSLLIF